MPDKEHTESQRDIQSDLRILEQENQMLMERAEEITLLSTVGDILYASNDVKAILQEALERVSIFLDIPFCAFGVQENGVVKLRNSYMLFSNEGLDEDCLTISPELLEMMKSKPQFLKYNPEAAPQLKFCFKAETYEPRNVGLLRTSTIDDPVILFVFADDSRQADSLEKKVDILRAIQYKISTRLDNLGLRKRLELLNTKLEARVQNRTLAYEESEERFRRIMQQSPHVVELYDLDGLQIDVNEAYEKFWGVEASRTLNKFNLFSSPEVERVGLLKHIKQAYAGQSVVLPEYVFDPGGETETQSGTGERWLTSKIYPLKDIAGNVKNIVITHEDVSQRIQAEAKLVESEARYRGLFEKSIDAICTLNASGDYVDVNPSALKLLGIEKSEILGMNVADFVHPEDHGKSAEFLERLKIDGFYQGYEGRVVSKNGDVKHVSVSSIAIVENGELVGSHDILRDVSDRVAHETKINANLAEKEILLQEIQHRTKNNMMVIIALLNMQRREMNNPDLDQAFKVTQDRIYAMSLVYDQLQKSEDIAAIDLGHYVKTLAQKLHTSLVEDPSRILFNVECGSIPISMTQAVPLGIALNEIITNSLLHGFPDKRSGKVSLTVELLHASRLRIEISDDGVGMPEDQVATEQETLGLRLVSMLVIDQLAGEQKIASSAGFTHSVEFDLISA